MHLRPRGSPAGIHMLPGPIALLINLLAALAHMSH